MKPTRPVVKSLKIMIKKVQSADNFYPNKVVDTTVIPIGSTDSFIELPRLRDTYTYNLINTAEMTGAITLKTSRGASLKGLILNNVGGTLNIEPIPQGTTSFEMGSDVKDGCFVETLSNGNNWFIWSVATHGTLGIGQVGNNNASPPTSTTTQVPTPVTLNPIQSNTTFPPSANFEARHSIIISGDAEPGATIVISEESGLIGDITVTVEDDGSWSTNEITDLENEDYNFVFTPSVGEAATDQEFASNDGVLSFATPQSFTIERGEAYDFTVGASAVDTNNVLITPFNVDDSQYNTSLVHGATFDIVYSFNYLGTPYTRTVSGVVEDTIAPAKPTIASATFDSVNINDFTATGAAEDGSTVEIFFDGVSQGTVTSVGGTWSYTSTFVFNQTFEITVQATDSASNISEESDATSVVYSPPTLTRPTLTIVNAPINTWTNQANTIELSGTTDAGSTIVIKDGNVVVTPVSGPNYSGNNWDATINVADESNSSITIEASKANFNSPSPSIAKTLLIDRVPPAISGTPLGDLTVYLGNIGDNNDNIPTATDFSSATVASDWSTQVDATEGAKTVTYTATDLAGNTATDTRTVNVSTEVIIPTSLVVINNGNGTVTITGDVTGTYADNLDVKIYVTDNNGLEEVYQESGVDVEFDVNSETFSALLTLSPDTYTFQATTVNSESEESSQSVATGSETITASGDTTIPVITLTGNASVSFTVGGTYTDAGATATDDVDGDITSNIVTTIVDASDVAATLDSNTVAGIYTVRYDVSDAAGNHAETVERTVEALATSFLEDLDSISTHGNADIVNGIFSRNRIGSSGAHGATFNLVDEGIVTFNSDGTRVDEELTVSFWFRPDEAWGNNWFYVGGHERGAGTQFKLAVMNNGGNLEFRAILFGGTQYKNSPSSSALNVGDWYHLAMTYSQNASNPSNHDLKMFVNGEKVIESLNLSGNLMKMTNAVKDFAIGGYAFGSSLGGNSLNHSSNSWQIASGIALTEGQVAAIANQSDQEMTIAEAAANESGVASVIDDVYNDSASTIVGSPTLTNSILEITGDDYIINGDIAEYMYQDYLSISFWIKSTEETQAAVNKFVSLGWSHAGNNKFGHVIGTQTTSPYNGFRVITPSGGVLDETVPTGDWFDEQWHMLTLTWDNINGEKKFYYDGQQLGTTTTFSSKSDPFRDGDDLYGLIIGTGTGAAGGIRSGEAFRGKMTNMVINNFIWTDQQVSDLYDVNFNGNLHFSANIEEVGTLSGNASLVNGVLVSSALGDYTSMPMTSAFKSNSFQTISFWFKTTYTPTNGTWMRFIHSQVNGQGSNGFFIEMRSSTKIYFKGASQALVADNNPAAEAPSALNDGAWHQIIVSWEDLGVEKLRIWVDGAPMTVLDETLVGSGNDNKNTLFIGAKQFDSPMEMDKVAITEEFIDDAEALARYNYEAP